MRTHLAAILGIVPLLCALAGTAPTSAQAAPKATAKDAERGTVPAAALPQVEIDRIEITGVSAFKAGDVTDLLELSPGDRLDRVKVIRSSEAIEEFYRSRGYERASVRVRLSRQKGDAGRSEQVLDFVVTEGKPTRIASVRFVPDSIRNDSFRKFWRVIESDLGAKSGLAPGVVFDQEKLAAAKRTVQDLMASEEFVGAKIDEVKVAESAAPADLPPGAVEASAGERSLDAGRWVSLEFQIDLGDRVTFGFRGNTVFTIGKLSGLVDEQRVVGFGRDYIGAIRARIEEEYRAEGFADVKVVPYTIEKPARQERRVTYGITEGPRVVLDTVHFEGNSVFSNDALREQFNRRASNLVANGFYVEKDVQKAADLTVEWMKSNGYLAAKVVTITTLPAIKAKRAGLKPSAVRIIVYVYEGDQTLVRSVELEGIQSIPIEEIKSRLALREGQPLNLFAFSEGIESVKAAYRAKGHLAVRITNEGTDQVVRYSDENRLADVRIEVVEGPQYKVSSIEIEGLGSTKEVVVRREITLRQGEILSEAEITETEARLRRLGIFSSVAVHLQDDPARPDAKRVIVTLQEGTPGVLAGGPGFRNDFGARLFGQLAYTNLLGLNHTLSLTTTLNRRIQDYRFFEYQAQIAYLYPWFLGYDVNFRPSFTASGTQYLKFDATVFNASATWEKKLLSRPSLTALFTYSLERVRQFNAPIPTDPSVPDDNQQIRIGAITPAIRLDTRDNPLAPTTGWFVSLSGEFASPWLFSQTAPYPIGYNRFAGRVDRVFNVGRGISAYLSFRAGYEISTEPPVSDSDPAFKNSGSIPLIKHFAVGGAGSIRGYLDQELNAYDLSITGSLSYVNYRAQVDFPLAGALKIGPFLDAGNLLVDNHSVGQFLFDQLQFGAGFGFHYVTPVGPVNLDLGFKLSPPGPRTHPRPGEGNNNFYFSIGLI